MDIHWKQEYTGDMEVRQRDGVTYLSYPRLERESAIVHGFSTRLGGVSEGCLGSMNLTSDQTHTTNVRQVGKEDCGCGVLTPRTFHDIDGLITNEPGVTLATFYADCVPLYFYDPIHKAIGLSHSGWRGTVGNIAKATVEAMQKAYHTDPADLIAAIGPSICQDCYEVSEDVIEEFRQAYPETIHTKLFYRKPNGKYQLNLWEACHQNFLTSGIREENILIPNLCTCCNPDFLYSHRASHGKRGNLAAFLGLR